MTGEWLITLNGDKSTAYHAIGDAKSLQDAAYDRGAMGVSVMEVK